MTQEIWLIRHGETAWSLSGQHTSRTDLPLTPRGEQRARDLGRIVSGRPFSLALSSPLQRAVETSRLAGFTPELTGDLREWDYGDYEGRTTADIQKQAPGWTIWNASPPNGETIGQVAARVDRVIARVAAADGNAILFAHGHLLRVLAARWIGLDASGGRSLALSTGSVSVLGYERETRVIQLWNQSAQDQG